MELSARLQRNLSRLRRNKEMIDSANRYIDGLSAAQSMPFAKRGMGNLGFSLEVAGYDLFDTDTYKDAYNWTGDQIDDAWAWLEDSVEYVGDGVVDVWDRLGEQIALMKDGFTSMLDIAYVTADGIAELWALYKWVGGPSEMLEIRRKRDSWLIRKKDNPMKYGPYYMRANEDGSKPIDMPSDARMATFISKEQASSLPEDSPDFLGTHTIIGLPQATWKYYIGGYDGITPDWRNPLHYPNAVLYWYYDAQIEKMEAIAADFDKSALGRSRDWLFERGTLLKAWMAGGWEELFNMKQIIEQNYRVAKAKTDLIGHEAVANIQGAVMMTSDGDTEQADNIEVLGIKSSKQVALDKIQKLRKMFPYNAKAFMGPQMWFTMHDFRQKKTNKESTPYPLIMLDDKIDEQEMSSLMTYLANSRDAKIAEAQDAASKGIESGANEALNARNEYNAAASAVNNMPMIFVEGMMSAFGGRAGPFFALDADMQFGDFVWANSDAFAISDKPEKPSGIRPYWRDIANASIGTEVENAWLTGPIGNTVINREAWLNAQPAISVRGWGYGTQIFTPADTETGEFGFANYGHFFDWHPFNALWCHDGETHMGGQYTFLHNSVLNSQNTADFSVLQSDLDGAYMSDWWAWNEAVRFKPLYYLRQKPMDASSLKNLELRDVDFLVRRNRAITDFANSGIELRQSLQNMTPIANMRMTSDASIIAKNEIAEKASSASVEGNSGADATSIAAGVFGATTPKGAGLYSLNASPVQSIFAAGITNQGVRSIWSATVGKGLKFGPAIGHGKKVRFSKIRNNGTRIGGSRFVAGLSNYHTVTTIGYNPYAVTVDRNYGLLGGIGGSYKQRTYLFNIAPTARTANEQFNWITTNILDNYQYPAKKRDGSPATNASAWGGPVTKGRLPVQEQRSINWFTLGAPLLPSTSFSGEPEITNPGFNCYSIGWSASRTDLSLLLAGITPPVETVSQTGLTPRPGLYSSNLQSGKSYSGRGEPKPGFGRFPGGHDSNWVALGRGKGVAYDYVDPLFATVLTYGGNGLPGLYSGAGPASADYRGHTVPAPVRKVSTFGLVNSATGSIHGSTFKTITNFDQPNLLLGALNFGQIDATDSGIFNADFNGINLNRAANNMSDLDNFLSRVDRSEKMTASANFNYARMRISDITKLATSLRNSWRRKPENAHVLLATVINEVLEGRKLKKVESLRFSGTEVGGDPRTFGWVDGENVYYLEFSNGTKFRDLAARNLDVISQRVQTWSINQIRNALNSQWLEGSSQKLISSIVLAEPDSNPMGVWFETSQPDHEFFGITDMVKMQENAELILNGEQMKLMNEGELWNFHRALANKDKNRLTPDVVDWFNSKVTKYGWCHVMQGAMPVRLDKLKSPAKMPRFWAPLFVPFRPIAEFAPRVYFGTSLETKGLYNTKDLGDTVLAGGTDSTGGSGLTTGDYGAIPYYRQELVGVAPHASENDDIRLHDSVRIVPDAGQLTQNNWDEAKSQLDGTGDHWASQYSWLNCGWFGFDSIAEAQMFMKLQFDTTTVSFEEASYEWKGMLNGPPTGKIGFGPIDDLIDFVRYFDSLIMSKIDVERAYLSALRRYESMKLRFDKMAQFRIDLVDASLEDLTSGLAKVVQTGNAKPKTYRWLPVFAYDDNGVAKLHPDNAEAIFMMMEAQPNAELMPIENSKWPAATTSPSKFVAGVIIEQQIDNDLSEGADWDFLTYIATQGRDANNDSLSAALTESGFPNAPADGMTPWIVGGKAVRKKVDITGGVFKDWERILTSDNSPLGRFLNKMRLYNQNIENLWNVRLPGFSMSMKEFWSMLGEDNTVISDFIGDVVDLFKNARADYGQVASSVVNINDKIETYLDNFEKMSINWSNSIEAMNKYADYMAKNLYSLNEKFEFALEKFQAPYQTFQDVITSEESPIQFDELVAKLDRVFNKNNKMTSQLANKIAFSGFKDDGAKARNSARDIIASINASGLAQIDVSNTQQKPSNVSAMIKPWLELPPPPHIDLNIRAPKIRQWVSEEVDPEIEGGWSSPEFVEGDLPSNQVPQQAPIMIDPGLLNPGIAKPPSKMPADVEKFLRRNYQDIAAGRITNPSRDPLRRTPGDPMYSTFPSGTERKMTGTGPNGEIFDTYFGTEPPTAPQPGDRWMNQGRVFVWNGEQWLLEQQLELIEDSIIKDGAIVDPSLGPGSELTDLITGGGMVEAPTPGNNTSNDTSNDGGNAEIDFTKIGGDAGSPGVSNPKPRLGPMAGALRGPLSYRR